MEHTTKNGLSAYENGLLSACFRDTESSEVMTGGTIYAEWAQMVEEDPINYGYSFSAYIDNCLSKNGFLRLIDTSYQKAEKLAAAAVDYIDTYDLWDAFDGTPQEAEAQAISENADILFSGDDGGILGFLWELIDDSEIPEDSAKLMSLADEIEIYTKARKLSA